MYRNIKFYTTPDELKKAIFSAPEGNTNASGPHDYPDRGGGGDIQGVSDVMAKAQESGGHVQSTADSYAERHGGVVTPINYKSEESIARKVKNEYGGDVSKLKDAVRTTVIVPDDKMEAVFQELQKDPNFIKVKWQRPDEYGGYSGIITNIMTPNGLVGEVQVNTAKMIYAKNNEKSAKKILGEKKWNEINKATGLPGGLGHKFYEEVRVMSPQDPKRAEVMKKQEEYYKNFL